MGLGVNKAGSISDCIPAKGLWLSISGSGVDLRLERTEGISDSIPAKALSKLSGSGLGLNNTLDHPGCDRSGEAKRGWDSEGLPEMLLARLSGCGLGFDNSLGHPNFEASGEAVR